MELVWEDPPVPDGPFFTRDLYDKYSLAPNIRELWALIQSPSESANIKQECDSAAAKASRCPAEAKAAELKDNSCISSKESHQDGCSSDDPCAGKQVETESDDAYPEPRVPYPRLSGLSGKDLKTYLDILMSKKARVLPQNLNTRVNKEVMEFMRYLQDVAYMCAEDYNFISQGAMQYSEDVLKGGLECVKTFPQLYQIHEMTSLTGGTFSPGLTLTFEKQLLIMGNVDITDHKMVPADAQLASDYQSVSSVTPPAKKAKDMHAVSNCLAFLITPINFYKRHQRVFMCAKLALIVFLKDAGSHRVLSKSSELEKTVSRDSNAEKLCARYEPHVCLTRDALFQLLDNHGPDFKEQWEVPVWVKSNPGKGSVKQKTVYIDSPLLKTDLTVRERSHIYHEESLKLSIQKNGSKNVFHLLTERPETEQQLSPERSKRNLVSFEDNGLDFEVDLTDLETFGEMTPVRSSKTQNNQDSCVNSKKETSSPSLRKAKRSKEHLVNTGSSSQGETDASSTEKRDAEEATRPGVEAKTEQNQPQPAQDGSEDVAFTADSDDEKLIIDDSVSPAAKRPAAAPCSADPTLSPESGPGNSASASPQKGARQRRQCKRAKVSGDQLGEILRMQTAMFSPGNDATRNASASQETGSPGRSTGPSAQSHPMSLVKPCVSSYLERSQNQDGETWNVPREPAPEVNVTEHKRILSEVLQAGAEDEQDYDAPEEGNLLYKLYSLQDLLLMVRSSVSLTHSRKVGGGPNQFVPLHVLPKLEYQLCYGVESLSSREACRLWTETMLHSSTVSYTAHINAFTSKVALLRKLPDDWKQNVSCGFKPSKSLNILHHLLKKLTGNADERSVRFSLHARLRRMTTSFLYSQVRRPRAKNMTLEEGQYLIAHKAGEPFVTLLKATKGEAAARGSYNLEKVHSAVPQPPAPGPVPWIPVDPAVVLPFHLKHGQPPCTFPLKVFVKTAARQSDDGQPGQPENNLNVKKKKKKKKKRAERRNNYIRNLIQKSV